MNTITQLIEQTAKPVDVDSLDTAKPLAVIFEPYQTVLAKWEAKVGSLIVTDISQKTEMAQARLARLELKDARVTMDKTRKGLVEKLKARTGAIDGAARAIREKLEELEAKLLESEEFADRHRAKLKAEIKANREAELVPLLAGPLLGDLSDLSEADYAKALADAKLLRQAKIDAAAKAEADRVAKEKADAEERERVRLENERLKAEAIEREAAAKAEREKAESERKAAAEKAERERKEIQEAADLAAKIAAKRAAEERAQVVAKAKAERDAFEAKAREEKAVADAIAATERAARQKLEAERHAADERASKAQKALENDIKRLRDAEAAKEKVAAEAARKAAAAPDKAKLAAFAVTLGELPIPRLTTAALETDLRDKIINLALWCDNQAKTL